MPSSIAKGKRGNYAKLICFNCRERRIKCKLPEDVQPSPDPQPAEKACYRCQQRGLRCIVRRTTLGRPSARTQVVTTPDFPCQASEGSRSRSPSPHVEDFVMYNPGNPSGDSQRQMTTLRQQPTSIQLAEAVRKLFHQTLSLLARDRHFGSSLSFEDIAPVAVQDVIDEKCAEALEPNLVWLRLFRPYVPSLVRLRKQVCEPDSDSNLNLSGTLLLALLCSIALDVPVNSVKPMRHLQGPLRCIIYHTGRNVLFSLPKHEYTITALELVAEYQPLAMISGRQAAAHALRGELYTTLAKAVALDLGLDTAPARLRACLQTESSPDSIQQLVIDTLRWSCWVMSHSDVHRGFLPSSGGQKLELVVEQALEAVSDAFDRNLAPPEAFMLFYLCRYRMDRMHSLRNLARDFNNLEMLAANVNEYEKLREQRKAHFDQGLRQVFGSNKHHDEVYILSQLSNMEQTIGRADVMALAMFYAIVGAHTISNVENKHNHTEKMMYLNQYYQQCLSRELRHDFSTPVGRFLDQFGDEHVNALEQRLTDFISIASDVTLQGIPFTGTPRHTSINIFMACKGIVENNAVRLKVEGIMHHRVDVQLILFLESARRLEHMEVDGGTSDAMSRGSVCTACAKLIRSLHRIILQWKRDYVRKDLPNGENQTDNNTLSTAPQGFPEPQETANLPQSVDLDDLLADAFFQDWGNWPPIGPGDMSNLFTFDMNVANP